MTASAGRAIRVEMKWIATMAVAGMMAADAEWVRFAEEGRLQLKAGEAGVPVTALTVDGAWMDPGKNGDVSFPIDWWRWTEVKLRFTPAEGGNVALHLSGPWAEGSPRQEVLWDDFSAVGTEVVNGDFARGIEGWNSPWKPYPTGQEWPVAGNEAVGASWLGRPLVQELAVKAREPVELRFRVKAAKTPGFRGMKKLEGRTPAHEVAERLKRGVNLGNCWEAPVGSWGMEYTVEDIDRIAAAGFDHVRVPVGWHHRMRDGRITDEFFEEVEPILKRALERGLHIVLDWHAFKEFEEDPEGNQKTFYEGWRQLAEHFKEWPPELCFELLNEPSGKLDRAQGGVLNLFYAKTLQVIRAVDEERIVFVSPRKWAVADQLGFLVLPDDERRVIVSFHCYDPFPFTHQQAAWVGFQNVKDVVFPGPPDKPVEVPDDPAWLGAWFKDYGDRSSTPNPSSLASMERSLEKARQWSEAFGRPVHLGEFGAVRQADVASRKRYAKAARMAAETRGIPWCWWEWKVGFGVIDAASGKPLLIDELTGG